MRDITRLVQEATGQHGLLTTVQLRELGCTDRSRRTLIAAGVLIPMRRGVVRVVGFPTSWHQRLHAVVLAAAGRCVVSHRSALRLHGLRERFGGLEITVAYPGNVLAPGVIVHRSRTLDTDASVAVAGLPVTSAARTILDVANLFPDRELGRIVDHGLATRAVDLVDLDRVRDAVGRSGVAGLARFDRVVATAAPAGDAESGPEVALRRALVEAGLPEPVVQHAVVLRGNRYRLDLAYPERRVALEYDGFAAHRSHRAFEVDRQRQNHLVEAGWTVLRFTARDLREGQADAVAIVRSALDRFSDEMSARSAANSSPNR